MAGLIKSLNIMDATISGFTVLLSDKSTPLLPKLVKQIQQLEFVEMVDLLPKAWFLEASTMEAQLRRQKGPVTDNSVWMQCFVTFVSTLPAAQSSKINELMALATIVRCHCD